MSPLEGFLKLHQRERSVPGVSFNVTVHTGDVYFMMSRWASFPGFSTCNNNEMQLRGMKSGHACGPRLAIAGQ